jgi:xylulokinase
MYLPYLMGERTPHLDSHCRGAFVGLSAIHNKKDLARAVMEGVSYSLKDCLDVLDEMDVHPHNIVLCGGGSKSGVWRQMLSDLFFINVSILQTADNAALGAAILAMAAAGIYPDVQTACSRIVKTAHFVAPNKERHQTYKAYHQVYKGLYTALKDSFHKLSEL